MFVESVIKSNFQQLTKSEKKVATYILDNMDVMVHQTMANIAKNVGVGEATLARFLLKCGFQSLHALKYSIVKDLENARDKNTPIDYIEELFGVVKKQIDATNNFLDRDKLREVAKKIQKAKNVYFFGIGHSGIVAELGSYRFMRVGRVTKAVTDIHYQSIQATITDQEDIVIGISKSATSPEMIKSLSIAKKHGATVVLIASNLHTEMTELSDYVFLATCDHSYMLYNGGGFDACVTQMLILDSLVTEYTYLDPENIRDLSDTITESFSKGRE
ncbi:MAG: MurR/RpiR family transcriptional regulator [Erysipelotrichaceae bacterium]|nr:MurR/RpiR family transcriptional regulator [Erysipelotrichaceae bacterium]